jgi:acetyltransferase-like isoleucine patch superfamily enzyme
MNLIDVLRSAGRIRNKAFSLAIAHSFAAFGPSTVLAMPVRVDGPGGIALGREVSVGPGSWLQSRPPVPGSVTLHIGKGVKIVGGCTLSASRSVIVEDDVLMARGVYIADHTHLFSGTEQPIVAQGDVTAPVRIGRGAWLGQNAFVKPGVTIGRYAVVGANSVVTRDVPDHGVVAGVPARTIPTSGRAGDSAVGS